METADRPRGQRGGRSGVRCSQADGLRPAPVAPQSLVSSQPSGTSKRQLTRASPRVLAGRAVGSREQGARAYAGPISSPPWRPRRRSFEALEHHRSGRRDGPQGVDNYHHPGTQGGDGRGHVTTPTKARPPGVTTLFPGASQGCRLNRRVWGQFFGSRRFNRRVTRGFGPRASVSFGSYRTWSRAILGVAAAPCVADQVLRSTDPTETVANRRLPPSRPRPSLPPATSVGGGRGAGGHAQPCPTSA